MASYSASIDLQVRADKALSQIGKVEQAINRLSGIGSAGKEFKEALVPDTKQLGRLGKELDAIKSRANSTAKVFARLFEGVGTAGVTAAGLEAINAKMFELAASTGTAAASIQALDKNTGDLSRFIPGFTVLKDAVNASAVEVNKLQYGLQQFLNNTEGVREFVQNFYTMDGAAGAATAGLLALAGVLEGQLRQSLGDIEQAGSKVFKGLQEDIANNTSELNRLINATRGTADQYRNLIRLGEERRDSYNSSSREARQAINTIVRAEEKLTDELRAQADLKRAAKGITVTELEAAKGRKSIETRERAKAYRTEQARLREQEEKDVQDTVNALKQQRVQESAVTEEVAQRTRELNNQVRLRASILQKIQDVRSARIARERSAFLQGDPQVYERPAGPGGAFRFPQADAIEAAAREQKNFNALQEEARKKAQGNLELQYNWAKALGQRAEIAKELRDVAAADLNTQKQAAKAEERRLRLARRRANVIRAREKAGRTKQAVGEGIIGGAFPLLFGQGAGAALGGGLGGAAGGLLGGQFGFGLSLVGTGIGQAIDTFLQSTNDLSVAMDTATDSTQALEKFIGRLDSATSNRLRNLAESGQIAAAADLAFKKLSETIGTTAAAAVVQAGRDLETAGNLWAQFTSTVNGLILALIQDITYRNLDVDPLTGKPRSVGPAQTEASIRATQASKDELEIARLSRQETEAAVKNDYLRVAQLQTAQAEEQANNDALKIGNDLKDGRINKQIAVNRLAKVEEDLNKRLLEIGKQRRDAAEAKVKEQQRAADKAKREAERAEREAEAAARKESQVQKAIASERFKQFDIDTKLETLGKSRLEAVKLEQESLLKRVELKREEILLSNEDFRLQQARLETLNAEAVLKTLQLKALEEQIMLEKQITDIQGRQEVATLERSLGQELGGIVIPSGNSFADQQAELQTKQANRYANAIAGINDQLEIQRDIAKATDAAISGPAKVRIKQLERQKAVYETMLPQIAAAEQAQLKFNQTLSLVEAPVNAFVNGLTQGLQGIIDGTMSAEEAFAKMLRGMADALVQIAATMIAESAARAITEMITDIPKAASEAAQVAALVANTTATATHTAALITESAITATSNAALTASVIANTAAVTANTAVQAATAGFAEGGFVTGPTRAIVGEGSQPEYIIPENKMSEAMSRYNAGARGNSVIPGKGGGGGATAGASGGGAVINYNGPTLNFNSEDYVPTSAVAGIIDEATKRGAKAGEARTFATLRNSRSQRSRIGI